MCVKGDNFLGLQLFGQHTAMSSAKGTPVAPWWILHVQVTKTTAETGYTNLILS